MGSQMAGPWGVANGAGRWVAVFNFPSQAASQLGGYFVRMSHASAPFLGSQDVPEMLAHRWFKISGVSFGGCVSEQEFLACL